MLTEGITDEIADEEAIREERAAEENALERMLVQPIHLLPHPRAPVVVTPETTVRDAVARMNRDQTGCVLVVERDRLIGLFTERDVLVKIVGGDVDADRTTIGEVMTPAPECLHPEDGIVYALHRMVVGGFRHVPLIDHAGRPVGVVAMRHIVEYLVDCCPQSVLNLAPDPARADPRERDGA